MPDFCGVCGEELGNGENECIYGHTQSPVPVDREPLIALMQAAVSSYLEPSTYTRYRPGGTCKHDSEVEQPHPNASTWAKGVSAALRDSMFISDIIYFLDSEEHGTNRRK